jgi:spermidine synthase
MSDRNKALLLAFASGLLSLGMEIVWTRLVSFTHHTVPQSFAYVLFAYLLGIALGAHAGKIVCNRGRNDVGALWKVAAQSLIWSAIFDVVAVAIYAVAPFNPYGDAIYLLVVIMLSAAIKGIIFPIVHAIGSMRGNEDLGASISNVYAANVVGATIGPLFVGFVLLNLVSLQQAMLICSIAALLVWVVVSRDSTGVKHKILAAVSGVALLAAMFITDEHLLIRQLVVREHGPEVKVGYINESRHGTIHTINHEDGSVVVYGENLYDGKINTSLVNDINGIFRVYALAAMHDNPKKILVIGMSGGSWVEVLRHFPRVQSIDVVEINPNYIDLVRKHKEVAPLLNDKLVKIHITDGRKYLKQHPSEKYDLIVMNTTWHWRAYSALLLGQDFLTSLKNSLAPGGLVAFNTTGSMDVFYTASQTFAFAGLYSNFVFASDHDPRQDLQKNALRIQQVAKFVSGPQSVDPAELIQTSQNVAGTPIQLVSEVKFKRPPEVVTERNMITEYKYGIGFLHH